MRKSIKTILFLTLIVNGCSNTNQKGKGVMFKDDVEFLKKHTDVVVISNESGNAKVAVCSDLQGRVMTSTASGDNGLSFGWINREFIASGENNQHFNPFGGEDRFWLGPEGGQFSVFFEKGVPFDMENWFTPKAFNEGPYELVQEEDNRVVYREKMFVENYSNNEFDLELTREIKVLEKNDLSTLVEIPVETKFVAYQSINKVKNIGEAEWNKRSGMLSIWILGMFNPSPATTIVIPFKTSGEEDLGPVVNDAYFGRVPAERLVVKEDVLFFSGDGQYRSKIGISPKRVKPVMGSYDAINNVLTLVHFTIPEGATDYVNSMWKIQERPFAGDVANSYNDGPTGPGEPPLGPFYELESSSPALNLKPEDSKIHKHTTIHFEGDKAALDQIAKANLGVGLDEIKNALK